MGQAFRMSRGKIEVGKKVQEKLFLSKFYECNLHLLPLSPLLMDATAG